MPELNDLITLIKSRTPLIVVETEDEVRAYELVRYAALHLKQNFYRWSVADGLALANNVQNTNGGYQEPIELLRYIWSLKYPGVFLLLDFHPFINDPKHIRIIKEIALHTDQSRQIIVFLSVKFDLPGELNTFSAHFELELPTREIIEKIIFSQVKNWSIQNGGQSSNLTDDEIHKMSRVLYGLSTTEVKKAVNQTLRETSAQNHISGIGKLKYDILKQSSVLAYECETSNLSQVGGFKNLKEWLQKRQMIFLGEKNMPGLDAPKGILLLGVQGGGKSLAAKAVAGTWGVPLLRLDIGALYDKYIGETERKTRDSLKMAERMSPCVLWIDEIEKGISTGGENDGGVSQRVLGTLLTWMAEKKEPVFVVATANNVQSLPPELLRKGRFDEVFFVDLPDEKMRKEIFSIHLKKRGFDPALFNLDNLSQVSDGFSGAEIEQALVSGLYSMANGSGTLTNDILITEVKATRPLSVLMAEQVDALRDWAKDRTVSAN
ncbi:MAG: AAA family ATPase [Bacteroidota bacterium]|jgi:ATP-dependent 26S proteasome regulatory subunit